MLVVAPLLWVESLGVEAMPDPADVSKTEWFTYWRKWPIAAWLGELKGQAGKWFRLEGERFVPNFAVLPERRDALTAMKNGAVAIGKRVTDT